MKRFALSTALLLACVPGAAWAKNPTCTVSATAVAFGTSINPLVSSSLTPTGTITVACTNGFASTTFTIAATAGSGSFAQRYMKDSASNQMNYNLYTDTNHTVIWGDGTGGSSVINGANEAATTTYTVYGKLSFPQTLGPATYPDAYSDTITMTLTY